MKTIQRLGMLCTLAIAMACGSVADRVTEAPIKSGSAGGANGVSYPVATEGASAGSSAGEQAAEAGAGDAAEPQQAEAGAAGQPAATAQRSVIWDIGGQSNAVGQGVYSGTWMPDVRVSYFVDGKLVPFAPPAPPGLHGIELSLGTASADATVMPVAINKSADNGRSCAYLSTTDWPAHATGIDAVKGLGSDYEFAWIQGESDALAGTSQADYESCLKGLLVKIRTAFGCPVRAYILLLNKALYPVYGQPGVDTVRAAQTAVVAADGNADLVRVDDMGQPALQGFHYDSIQLLEIGRRFEAARASAKASK